MYELILLTAGFAVGFAAGRAYGARSVLKAGHAGVLRDTENVGAEVGNERDGNLARLREHIARAKRVTNDEVEELLGVSDATATRYLEALEQEGYLRQVGEQGRGVYYEWTGKEG